VLSISDLFSFIICHCTACSYYCCWLNQENGELEMTWMNAVIKNRQDNRLEHFKRIHEIAVLVLKFRRSVVLLQSVMRQDGFWRWRMSVLYAAIWSADGNRVSTFLFKSISVAYCAIDRYLKITGETMCTEFRDEKEL